MLSRFLSDPAQQVGRFPLRKDRRQHLHQQIDRHRLDLTHVTERVGSPQTLVCTKTQASYERRQKQYEVDQKLLAELEALEELDDARRSKPRSLGESRSDAWTRLHARGCRLAKLLLHPCVISTGSMESNHSSYSAIASGVHGH